MAVRGDEASGCPGADVMGRASLSLGLVLFLVIVCGVGLSFWSSFYRHSDCVVRSSFLLVL